MATITLRDTKGAPLTHDEVDNNFKVLNNEKLDLKTGGTLEDNIKVNFGDDDDLQVWHDANDTYIKNTTGEFYIQGDNITIGADDPSKPTFMTMDENGAVELFFNNTKKLETTTDGINILGTLTVDGAVVGGSVSGDLGDATVTSLTSSGTVSAPLFAGGAITCTTLTSTGDIASGGDVSVAGGLTSDGDVVVNANASVSGSMTASRFVGGDILGSTITTSDVIASGSNVNVTGGVNTTGDVTVNGSINGGAITSSGTIVSQGAITAGGDVTVTGALNVTDAETTRANLNVDQAGEALAFAIALG
jgi:cytoskeletal protein CcmA (bactofilin family)